MNYTKKLYVMVSQTHTKFARVIRKIGKIEYNHVSISLDAELEQLYAFARPQHNGIFLARLVRESVRRYTLGKADIVNVIIFRLEVTEEQHQWVEEIIRKIEEDKEYIYNLLSVLTYPVSKGFVTYKAFSCAEFVFYILKGLGFDISKPLCRYKPDDMVELLKNKVHFKGNLLDYKEEETTDIDYFSPMSYKLFMESIVNIRKVCARSFLRREKYNQLYLKQPTI